MLHAPCTLVMIRRHLAVAVVIFIVLVGCNSTPKPLPAYASRETIDRMIAEEPTLELYDRRIELYYASGDVDSLRKALADVDSAEALGAKEQWKGGKQELFRQHRVSVHCRLFSKTNVEAERTACFAGVDDAVARAPSSDAHLWRANMYVDRGGDPATVEADVLAATSLFASEKQSLEARPFLHEGIARIYGVLAVRAAGSPDETRYKALAEQARRDGKEARALAGPDAAERVRIATDRERRSREQPAPKPTGPNIDEEAKRLHRDAVRAKGIAEHGACDGCGGTGEILHYTAKTGIVSIDSKSGTTFPCKRCTGTGFKGSDYSRFRQP